MKNLPLITVVIISAIAMVLSFLVSDWFLLIFVGEFLFCLMMAAIQMDREKREQDARDKE